MVILRPKARMYFFLFRARKNAYGDLIFLLT